MKRRSLKLRLLVAASIAVLAALAAGWVVMTLLFERHVERRVAEDLMARGRDVIAATANAGSGQVAISDPRFAAPAGGFYWQVRGEGILLRSRSLWDEELRVSDPVTSEGWTQGRIDGPFERPVVIVARSVRLEPGGPALEILVAEDRAHIATARNEFSRELALFLALLWIVLSVAAWAQVTLGLKPLEDVRAALDALRSHPSARLGESEFPAEVVPLAHAINTLAATREAELEAARRRAGDLAHSLKTPLAALAAQSRRIRDAGAAEAADGFDRAIAAARRAVERELARARAAASGPARTNGHTMVARLLQVIERTAAGERVTFENAVSEAPYSQSEDVLMEIVGPLLENAVRFARSSVRVTGDGRTLIVEDDGPGMSEADACLALERGRRLDESVEGDGLGLAIAAELARSTGGVLMLSRSGLGGLKAEVRWPLDGSNRPGP